LAPHCAAHDVIPLRSKALIEIGKPGTCSVDRCQRRHRGAPSIRSRIHHASRYGRRRHADGSQSIT